MLELFVNHEYDLRLKSFEYIHINVLNQPHSLGRLMKHATGSRTLSIIVFVAKPPAAPMFILELLFYGPFSGQREL